MPRVQLLDHRDAAVAAGILAVLRPAAAQEAQWLGLAPEAGAAQRTEADDLADIRVSPQLHLGAWLGPLQARRASVADPDTLAAVLRLGPEDSGDAGGAGLAPGRLCISLLVVAPWAQRHGLARALVQTALQRGRGWAFSVTAARANVAALALYQGLGFVPGRQGLLGASRLPVVQLLRAPDPA
jgi:ribosomal protein S18 acetylase RimI-like enzyme